MFQKGVSYWAIIIVLACFVAALIFAFWPQSKIQDDYLGPSYLHFLYQAKQQAIELKEKAEIEKWIVDNKLNQYGDSADTLYAGGTPLFNESTGKMIDRYQYILKNHPDKPWKR